MASGHGFSRRKRTRQPQSSLERSVAIPPTASQVPFRAGPQLSTWGRFRTGIAPSGPLWSAPAKPAPRATTALPFRAVADLRRRLAEWDSVLARTSTVRSLAWRQLQRKSCEMCGLGHIRAIPDYQNHGYGALCRRSCADPGVSKGGAIESGWPPGNTSHAVTTHQQQRSRPRTPIVHGAAGPYQRGTVPTRRPGVMP
jgi:hypothetical protein